MGIEIEDAGGTVQSLRSVIPSCQAIYLWRRTLAAPSEALLSTQTFSDWVEHILSQPFAEVKARDLSHFAEISGLRLRSRPLTQAKSRDLLAFGSKQNNRKFLAQFIEQVSPMSPPLYCGETNDLPKRVFDHITGATGFGKRVVEGAFAWKELALHYYELGDGAVEVTSNQKRRAELLELIASGLSLSGFVERRG